MLDPAIRLFWFCSATFTLMVGAASVPAQSPTEWHASAWQLWRIDIDGTHLAPLDTTPNSRCGSPDWSPDGKLIAYDVLDQRDGVYQTAIVDADGSNRRLLTDGSIPTWSPDGTLIACQSGGIRIINADGTGEETLIASAFSLRWLPNGREIVAGLGRRILSFDLASGMQQLKFNAPQAISHGFGISVDGRRYALGTLNSGMYVVDANDQSSIVATNNVVPSGTVYHTSWAPDGKRVVFAWRPTPEELTQIYTLDVDTNEAPKLLPGLDVAHQNVNPDWSPDGRTIVFSLPVAFTADR